VLDELSVFEHEHVSYCARDRMGHTSPDYRLREQTPTADHLRGGTRTSVLKLVATPGSAPSDMPSLMTHQ
jgi:hypothetical protein